MSENKNANKADGVSKIIIILLVLLIVLIGAFGSYIFFFGGASKLHADSASNNTVSALTITSADENTYSLDEAVVNLSDTDAQRYLKVKVSFGYDAKSSKLKNELESETVNKKPILSDAVNGILRSKKSSGFTVKGIEDTKQQILNAVNPVLKNGKISHVYFEELVVQ
ncbi:flagellar basal body-associated FliL family protein [Clostridium pasteurianum]|uniref:Flagellar protein FliL n=1 Tax=Clostridium pasteurianum BC1 TaxID=86416 RepID=R4KDS0_CLOPA|nr:flagellar basal body-associated FliL family protein [Clostridium pasteurianum]AGK97765.1 flagellar basal body-associated protein [Clostridium pasteurianum BC1]